MKSNVSAAIISKLLQNKQLTDVVFVLTSKSGATEKVSAHKAILAASSPEFETMFCGDLKENGAVSITDISAEAFREFLQFFYKSDVELTEEHIGEILKLIDKYNLPECYGVVEEFMQNSVTAENVCSYYELALSFNLAEGLMVKCMDIIYCNTENMLKSEGFLMLGDVALIDLLQSDNLTCDETIIFEAGLEWARRSLKRQKADESMENIKNALSDIIKCVRFPIMTMDQFLNVLERFPDLLDKDVYFDILNYINKRRTLSAAIDFTVKQRKRMQHQVDQVNKFWEDRIILKPRKKFSPVPLLGAIELAEPDRQN